MPINAECVCCGTITDELDIVDTFAGNKLRYCPVCHHVQVAKPPTRELVRAYYQGAYSRQRKQFIGKEYALLMRKRALAQIAFVEKSLSLSGLKVCDVGCGYGYLLETLQQYTQHGFGVEYDPASVDACQQKGLCVELVDSDEAFDSLKEADLVILSHCLEHFVAPDKVLQVLSQKSPAFFIEVPAYDVSLLEQFADQEGHVNFFNRKSLRLFLERNGMEIVSFAPCGPSAKLFYAHSYRVHRYFLRKITRDLFWGRYKAECQDGIWLRVFARRSGCS